MRFESIVDEEDVLVVDLQFCYRCCFRLSDKLVLTAAIVVEERNFQWTHSVAVAQCRHGNSNLVPRRPVSVGYYDTLPNWCKCPFFVHSIENGVYTNEAN